MGLAKCEARTEAAIINHVLLVCITYVFLQLLKPLRAQHRPSVRSSKHALIHLVMIMPLQINWQAIEFVPNGEEKIVSLDNFWQVARTRLIGIPVPDKPDFSSFYKPSSKAA